MAIIKWKVFKTRGKIKKNSAEFFTHLQINSSDNYMKRIGKNNVGHIKISIVSPKKYTIFIVCFLALFLVIPVMADLNSDGELKNDILMLFYKFVHVWGLLICLMTHDQKNIARAPKRLPRPNKLFLVVFSLLSLFVS